MRKKKKLDTQPIIGGVQSGSQKVSQKNLFIANTNLVPRLFCFSQGNEMFWYYQSIISELPLFMYFYIYIYIYIYMFYMYLCMYLYVYNI